MPYFVYRISEPKKLEHLDTKAKYQEARQLVRTLRSEIQAGDATTVRMIFARTHEEAEKLLSMPRDERVIGED